MVRYWLTWLTDCKTWVAWPVLVEIWLLNSALAQAKQSQAKPSWAEMALTSVVTLYYVTQCFLFRIISPLKPILIKAKLVDMTSSIIFFEEKNNMMAILNFCTKMKNSYFFPLNHHIRPILVKPNLEWPAMCVGHIFYQCQPNQTWWLLPARSAAGAHKAKPNVELRLGNQTLNSDSELRLRTHTRNSELYC